MKSKILMAATLLLSSYSPASASMEFVDGAWAYVPVGVSQSYVVKSECFSGVWYEGHHIGNKYFVEGALATYINPDRIFSSETVYASPKRVTSTDDLSIAACNEVVKHNLSVASQMLLALQNEENSSKKQVGDMLIKPNSPDEEIAN